MPAKPISHIEHRVPGTAVWRPGFTSHEETGTDLRDYLRPLEQVHNSCLHGSGVVEGFTVSASPGSSSVTVMPGVAVDPAGRHIVLPADGPAETADDPDTSSTVVNVPASGIELPVAGHGDNVLVTLQWRETFVDPPTAGDAAFVTRHTPWLRVVAADAEPAADRLVLATLVLGADGKIAAGGLRDTGRAALSLSSRGLALGATAVRGADGTVTLGESAAALLTGRPDGGLDVHLPGAAGRPALTVTGTGQLGSTVVTQALAVTSAATVGGSTTISGALDVTGAITVGGSTTIAKALAVTGAITVGGSAKISGALAVTGAITVGGSAKISGALDVTGSLSATGALTAGTTVTARALDVTGAATVGGSATIAGALDVGGAATVGGALGVGGALTVTGALKAGTASVTSLAAATLSSADATVANGLRVGAGGGVLNQVTLGTAGAAPAAVPPYPWDYETVGVNRPEHNLRLRSPNVIATHTYDPASQTYPERVRISGEGGFAHLTIGPAGNGRLFVRHIDGKHWSQDTNDGLFLNWSTGQPVSVGNPNNPADLNVCGAVTAMGSVGVTGLLGTAGMDPAGGLPIGWGGGVHTWDLFAEGSIGCGPAGVDGWAVPAGLNRDGAVWGRSKRFVIDHPLDPEHRQLAHGCIEGPEIGVYYRGEGRLVEGRSRVVLPDYFEALVRTRERTVLLTPIAEGNEPVSMLAAGAVDDGGFDVRAVDERNPSQRFYWEVKAVRADVEPLEVERIKTTERAAVAH